MMKRIAICGLVLAISAVMLLPAQAPAAKSGSSAAVNASLTAVGFPTLVYGTGHIVSMVAVTDADPAALTYARFWIDLPNKQINNPSATYTCASPSSPATCAYMGNGQGPAPSSNYPYFGPSGVHTAHVQIWRNNQGDGAPVFEGQASTTVVIP